MNKIVAAVFIIISFCFVAILATALTADEIVSRSLEAQVFKLPKVEAKITLIDVDERGRTRTKTLEVKAMRNKNGLAKTIMHFVAPEDVKGTGFLVLERKNADDDQFLYLPALKKVKRIRSDQKSNSFMGTQFSYGDLQSRKVEDHTHKILREENVGNRPCYVIESIPKKPEKEQYGKIVSWIDKQTFVPLKLKMFDKSGQLYKVMTAEKIDVVDGKYVITQLTMRNLKNNRLTRMTVEEINTKVNLNETDFTKEKLERF